MSENLIRSKKVRVALVAACDAKAVLRPSELKARFRDRAYHPTPWLRSLAQALAERDDVECHIFSHSRAVSRVRHGSFDGVPCTVIPQYEPVRMAPWHGHMPARIQFRKHIAAWDPDVVHGFGTENAYGLIATEQNKPSVIFIQGIMDFYTGFAKRRMPCRSRLYHHLERTALRRAGGIVAETAFAERWAHSINPNARIRVIPHGSNAEFFDADPRFDSERINAVCVGMLTPRKAADVAIRAVARARNSRVRLLILGYGPEQDALQRLARERGVADRVEFRGMVDRADVVRAMEEAWMLLLTSRMDTSPNILTEAHAAGLPVIGTRAGGIPDMIDDGRDGFLVDVDDDRAMADCIDRLCSDAALCERMGRAGREKVRVLNDPKRIAEQHVRLYHELSGK